jgi:peptidyl-tRNA hydrolase, PTH1 family
MNGWAIKRRIGITIAVAMIAKRRKSRNDSFRSEAVTPSVEELSIFSIANHYSPFSAFCANFGILAFMFTIVGLGNPGKEYEGTRHNAGRTAVVSLKDVSAKIVIPETFMNKSGDAVKPLVKNKRQAEQLIVVHDDLDLPLGRFRVSFNKSSGGHKGVESIMRAIKTKAFTRIRIGISPATASGRPKKPKGDDAVGRHILGKFKPAELAEMKKIFRKINEAIICLISEGRESAMSRYNR